VSDAAAATADVSAVRLLIVMMPLPDGLAGGTLIACRGPGCVA